MIGVVLYVTSIGVHESILETARKELVGESIKECVELQLLLKRNSTADLKTIL